MHESSELVKTPIPILRLGFRPLFLLGTVFAVLAVGWWTLYWLTLTFGIQSDWAPVGGPIWWHSHEMVFGFSTAIIGGFLLTAVRNWTGVQTITGWFLLALVLSWVAGRLAVSFGSHWPPLIVLLIDEIFLVGLVLSVGYPIVKAKMWRNLMFISILVLFIALNAISHISNWEGILMNASRDLAMNSIHSAIFLVCLLIVIIGGRVLPFFTANALKIPKVGSKLILEVLSVISVLVFTGMALYGLKDINSTIVGFVALMAGLSNLLRCVRWQFWLCGKVPLLWSLHLFFFCIPLGFILIGVNRFFDLFTFSSALHLMTVGAIGGMILSMITRVSLGHTGRSLNVSKVMTVAFVLMALSALVRSFGGTILGTELYSFIASGVIWVVVYAVFIVLHGPFLWSVRPDGKLT